MLLALTSDATAISGTYAGQDTRGPATPFAVTQEKAKSKWEQGLSDFLRGAGISISASGSGVKITDVYQSDEQTPPIPFLGAGGGNGAASLLNSPVVLVVGGVLLALVVRKLAK